MDKIVEVRKIVGAVTFWCLKPLQRHQLCIPGAVKSQNFFLREVEHKWCNCSELWNVLTGVENWKLSLLSRSIVLTFSHRKRLSKTLKRNKFQLKGSAKRAKSVIKIYFPTFSKSLEDIKSRIYDFQAFIMLCSAMDGLDGKGKE